MTENQEDRFYSRKEIQRIKREGLILCMSFGFGVGVLSTILILWSNHTIL